MKQYCRIRELREDSDLSQRKLGELLHISQRVYAYYESGEHVIPTDVLCALAEIHKTSVDYLLARTDEKNPYPSKSKK